MKKNNLSKIISELFVLLFINVNVNADYKFTDFTAYKQEDTLTTCWAACIRMVTKHYGVILEEKEIRSVAFNGDTSYQAHKTAGTAETLSRLLINTRNTYGTVDTSFDALASSISNIIREDRPIIASVYPLEYDDNTNELYMDERNGHVVTIIGYIGSGEFMEVIIIDPRTGHQNEITLSYFAGYDDNIEYKWGRAIYMLTPPPAPNQSIVGKSGIRNRTIMDAINKTLPYEDGIIHIITPSLELANAPIDTYEEQVKIDSAKFGIIITSSPVPDFSRPHPGFSRALLKHPNALINDGHRTLVNLIDIEGDNAVSNTGTLTLNNVTVSSASGSAVYNSGTIGIDSSTVFAESGYAFHNADFAYLNSAVLSSVTDTVIYSTVYLNISGETVITAPDNNGVAIYNSDQHSTLDLGGSPVITGRIVGFGMGNIRVTSSFNPGDKKYILTPDNLRGGEIVVFGGAKFIDNFELSDPNFVLTAIGNNLVAYTPLMHFFVSKIGAIGATFNTIKDATRAFLFPPKAERIIDIIDGETYNEQVTIDISDNNTILRSTTGATIEFRVPPQNYPHTVYQNYTGSDMPEHVSLSGDNFEDSFALRIFDPQFRQSDWNSSVDINGVNIRGDNAVYNTGFTDFTGVTISATSGYAIYNTGFIRTYRGTIISSTSGTAVYNTDIFCADDIYGTITVSSASGYAIHNASIRTLSIGGNSVITGGNDTAIYNSDIEGSIALWNNPTINGCIAGFGAGKIFANFSSSPGSKRYRLSPSNLKDGDVIVVRGANFINNFVLTDTNFILTKNGSDLIATRTHCIISFAPNSGTGEEMPAAIRVSVNSGLNETQVPRADSFTKTGYISDGKWYTLWGSQYNEFIFGENGTPLTDNTTLHLQWREAEVTITNTDFTFNNGKYNETYSGAVITASVESGAGGAILYSIAEGSLPDGLTLDTFTGEINGTAARAGYFIFTIRATNEASGAFAEKMFSINAAKAEYDMSGITFSDMAISYNGAAHSIFINGNLPEGLTAQYDGNGQTAEGTHTVTVRFTAADSVNYIVPQSMSALLIIAKTSSIDRVILPAEQGGKTPEILSVNVIPDGFSIGPNPVNKQADIVSFFRQGRGIENGTLYVYGSDGNLVRKIRINDKSCSGQQKRKVGEWDLTDSKGRHVSEGSYLIRGTIKTKNGNKEKISLVLGVR